MLQDADKALIQAGYRRWLQARGLQARRGQRLMIAEVARVLAEARSVGPRTVGPRTVGPRSVGPRSVGGGAAEEVAAGGGAVPIAAIEAGTGTGKTVAYLLPALVMAKARQQRLVISTATVSLQEQLINKDLPDLAAHAGLSFSFALAKGRGRYICKAKLVAHGDAGPGQNLALGFYPDELSPLHSPDARFLCGQLLDALEDGSWDGDRDHWDSTIANDAWQPLTSDHMQCTGRRCAYIKECAYFAAREGLDDVDCVVANHDLVLADLALGGGVILPEPEQTIYIFDEAHQLAEKAQRHFGFNLRLALARRWLEQVGKALPALARDLAGDALGAATLGRAGPALEELQEHLATCHGCCQDLLERSAGDGEDGLQVLFPLGEVPAALADVAQVIELSCGRLQQHIDTLAARVDDIAKGEVPGLTLSAPEQWAAVLGQIAGRLAGIKGLAGAYAPAAMDPEFPYARWLTGRQQGFAVELELSALPLLPRRLLQEMLWERCAAAILTSASMTALGRFDRLIDETGIPAGSRQLRLPSPFNHFEAAELCIPAVALDPADREAFTAMLCSAIPALAQERGGTLVLFSARRQMNAVYEQLPAGLQGQVLNQDHYGKQEIIRRHREAVDRGERSVIFGLASFAEGIDLPGDYCNHVVITRLPFAVPNDPLEASLAQWVRSRGGQPFRDIALPDAARKLVQASGRLLRTEQDRGRITILDRRIVSRQYGRALLECLPNYRLVTEAPL